MQLESSHLQFVSELSSAGRAHEKDVAALALDGVWVPHDGCLADMLGGHESTLNLCCANAVSRYHQHVVGSTRNPIVAIFVALGSVTRRVMSRKFVKVDACEAVVVAIDRTTLSWP